MCARISPPDGWCGCFKDWTPTLPPLALYYPGRKNPPAAFTAFMQAVRDVTAGRAIDAGPAQAG